MDAEHDEALLRSADADADADTDGGSPSIEAEEQDVYKRQAEKCTLCKERTDQGEEPRCVQCCPMDARIFGDLDDPDSEVSKVIRARGGRVLLEEQGTRPQVYYFE